MSAAVHTLLAITALFIMLSLLAHARGDVLVAHRHEVAATEHANGVDHLGVYEVCRCGRVRRDGDRRWQWQTTGGGLHS